MDFEPLILTAKLDRASFDRLDAMRRSYFPSARNFLSAHITLFHKLPGEEITNIVSELDRIASEYSPMEVSFPSLRFLGRGVAIDVESTELGRLRGVLARLWSANLGLQDGQKFRPHVTVQNKVDPTAARTLFDELRSSFEPSDGTITGIELWHYAGGPWRFEREFPFIARSR